MDPLSALSIAASVVQFLDFGAKLVGTGLEIYHSVDGATDGNVSTEYVVSHANDLCSSLATSRLARGGTLEERKLRELAQRGHLVAQELVNLLQSIKVDQSRCAWAAIRQACAAKWQESKIESLKAKLDALRSELSLQLLTMMCNEQGTILRVVQDVAGRCKNLELQSHTDVFNIQQGIEEILKQQSQALGDLNAKLDRLEHPSPTNAADDTVGRLDLEEPPAGTPDEGTVVAQQKERQGNIAIAIEFAAFIKMLGEVTGPSDLPKASQKLLETYERLGLQSSDIATILQAHNDDYFALVSAAAPACWKSIQSYSPNICASANEVDPLSRQLPILESLRFDELPRRESGIPAAFANTYSWIFNPQASKFVSWLESKGDIFWVNGKPGAGKSTLMKFLTKHPKTKSTLQTWSATRRLVLSKHFFWGTGTAMEKSYQGLLQGLVYQILREDVDLIQAACPRRWESGRLAHRLPLAWTVEELEETLRRTILDNQETVAFVFFIDGLDEFAEDHYMLITQVIEFYSKFPHVKFCVSSRPYNVFTKAFGTDPDLTFALQDLNGQDINNFVTGKLEKDVRFQALRQLDPRADELAQEIRRRADGVFLWVHLVVDELMRGFGEDDDIQTLRMRLDLLPKTLEEFFKQILNSVEQVYRGYTAKSLLLAHHAREPLPIMAYAFLYEDTINASYLKSLQIHPFTRQEINEKRRTVVKKITSWCRGLMEVVTYDTENTWEPLRRYRVNFLHRTVRDFLDTYDMQCYLQSEAGESFKPYETLAILFVGQSKVVDVRGGVQTEMPAFKFMADEATYYAEMNDVTHGTGETRRRIKRELEVVKQCLQKPQNQQLPVPHPLPTTASKTSSRSTGRPDAHAGHKTSERPSSSRAPHETSQVTPQTKSKSSKHSFFSKMLGRS